MNLITQATQLPVREYRKCEFCGGPIKSRKKKQRFCSRRCGAVRIPNNPEPTPEEIAEGIRRIELTQGQFAIIDANDYEWVNQWTWYAFWNPIGRTFYVARNKYDPLLVPHKQTRIMLHRELLKPPPDKWVDHEDGNPLNNRRGNLRLASPSQNASNRSKSHNKSSKYKGVSYWKPQNKWKASIKTDGRFIYLGSFHSELDAAEAYRIAAIKYHGEFACIPEPPPAVLA